MEDVGWVLRYYLHLFALHSYQNSFKSQVRGPDYFGLLFTLISLYLVILCHIYLIFPHLAFIRLSNWSTFDCERSHLVEDEQPDLLLTSPAMNQWRTIWNGQWTAMRLQRRQAEARAMKTKLYQTSHLNHPLGLKMMKAGHENHEYEGNWRNDRVTTTSLCLRTSWGRLMLSCAWSQQRYTSFTSSKIFQSFSSLLNCWLLLNTLDTTWIKMIQHGNMMQLLLWHALSTLKDSLKENSSRFPFPACCWAWSGRQWPESTPDCWWLWHLPNAHKHGEVLHSMFYWHLLTSIDSIRAVVQWSWIFGSQIFWAFREMRDTKVPSHSNIPTRAWVIFIIPFLAEQRSVTPCDTMWHHVTPTQRQKKRNSSAGPSAGPWDLVACPDIVAARASPDTEQKDIRTSCYTPDIHLKHS